MGTAGFVWYAHYQQTSERARMHEGVLRDIAREEEEKRRAREVVSFNASSEEVCESGVCSLSKKRIRVESE